MCADAGPGMRPRAEGGRGRRGVADVPKNPADEVAIVDRDQIPVHPDFSRHSTCDTNRAIVRECELSVLDCARRRVMDRCGVVGACWHARDNCM